MVGLAPTAKAADVLAAALDIPAENTAKWLTGHAHNTTRCATRRQLLDRAAAAQTAGRHKRAAATTAAVTKLDAQIRRCELQPGQRVRVLAGDRGNVPELATVRRFTHEWERVASIRLRVGNTQAIDDYAANGRIRGGATTDMMDAAYTA